MRFNGTRFLVKVALVAHTLETTVRPARFFLRLKRKEEERKANEKKKQMNISRTHEAWQQGRVEQRASVDLPGRSARPKNDHRTDSRTKGKAPFDSGSVRHKNQRVLPHTVTAVTGGLSACSHVSSTVTPLARNPSTAHRCTRQTKDSEMTLLAFDDRVCAHFSTAD